MMADGVNKGKKYQSNKVFWKTKTMTEKYADQYV
jgi:hypothetical protein